MSKKILLVDDEPSIRVVLGAILSSRGHSVQTAEDGFAALKVIRSFAPEVLITDLRMPNMNGFELLAIVRERFPGLPTIAISGEFVGKQVDGVLADAFLQKGTYAPDELLTLVERMPAEMQRRERGAMSTVWAPTGDGRVMLTCSECLKSFPLDPCDAAAHNTNDEVDCIFCGAKLRYQLVAVTKAAQ